MAGEPVAIKMVAVLDHAKRVFRQERAAGQANRASGENLELATPDGRSVAKQVVTLVAISFQFPIGVAAVACEKLSRNSFEE